MEPDNRMRPRLGRVRPLLRADDGQAAQGHGPAKYQRDGDPRTSGPGFGADRPPGRADLAAALAQAAADLRQLDVRPVPRGRAPTSSSPRVFAVMALAPQHTFQVLTKRHARMRTLLSGDGRCSPDPHVRCRLSRSIGCAGTAGCCRWPLPNVWLGVSAEDQHWADIRIPALLDTSAAVRFLSRRAAARAGTQPPARLPHGWHGMRPARRDRRPPGSSQEVSRGRGPGRCIPAWARTLRDQCHEAGVPFFFKQAGEVLAREWGCADRKGHDPATWPEPFPREFPRQAVAA